jgi:cytoplasmic tRNA 2-thiolation protein 1
VYEREIVFYALQKGINFQTEQCPYMHESIREELRHFINNMEKLHPGIKYNAYKSLVGLSAYVRSKPQYSLVHNCEKCGRDSAGDLCSVCKTLNILKSRR